MHPIYDIVLNAVRTDITQMIEQGHDENALLAELADVESSGSLDKLCSFQSDLWMRPSPPDFPYDEPNDWESISATFPPDSRELSINFDADLADRIHAAWLGRSAGCQLGKPLEGTMWPDKIRETLEFVGSWPLTDYMNPVPENVDPANLPDTAFFRTPHCNHWTKGKFDRVQVDDDIHYSITSLLVLEKYGAEFTTEQAVDTVHYYTPYSVVFAAGKNMFRTSVFGFKSPYTALFGNPCRQSLGGMIRCDPYGWCVPGDPKLAAWMAYKDSRGSQTRNGIYSAMFFAALMADSLAHGDPIKAIDTALTYIPPKSRFAEMVRFLKSVCGEEVEWGRATQRILDKYPEESKQFNHSIPNAAIVLIGILKGEMDFTKTLGITVMSGLDTDCNGATAGSIMGCALGTAGIPKYWTEPFHDRIETYLREMPELRISEMAGRTFQVLQHCYR